MSNDVVSTSFKCQAIVPGIQWLSLSVFLLQSIIFYYLIYTDTTDLNQILYSAFSFSVILNLPILFFTYLNSQKLNYLRACAISCAFSACLLALEISTTWGAIDSATKLLTIIFLVFMIAFYADLFALLVSTSTTLVVYAWLLVTETDRSQISIVISVIKHPIILVFFLFTVRKMLVLIQAEMQKKESKNIKLEYLSQIDYLTKLVNRKGYNTDLNTSIVSAKNYNVTFSLLILDIDYFKNYNDALGHPAGDKCLIEVAEVLSSSLQYKSDIAARIGGEEFAIILPNCKALDAVDVCQRIKVSLTKKQIIHPNSPVSDCVTLSIGVAEFDNDDIESIYIKADKALYQAKNNGRNRFEQYMPNTIEERKIA